MTEVFVREDGLLGRDSPVDAQALVENADASVGLRMVELVALVLEDRRVAKHCESVCKALGDKELAVVLFAQLDGHVPAESGAAAAQIHRHIEHRSPHAAYKLALGKWRPLEVKPPHHPV